MSIVRYIEAIKLDKERAILASKHKLNDLKKTYLQGLPEVKNLNTGKLWDDLNNKNIFQNLQDNPVAKDRISIVFKILLKSFKEKKILNVGFGYGSLERYALIKHKNILQKWQGIDTSVEASRVVNSFTKTNNFKFGSITNIKYPKGFFDCVICLEVLEHISPKSTLSSLSEIYKVLKNHGILIISTPLNENLEAMISSHTNYNRHVRVYTPDLIRSELEISNFKVIKSIELTAFRKQYRLRKIVNNLIKIRKSNNIIIIAEKI